MNTIISLLLLFSLVFAQTTYKKIIPNLDPQAKCLDGSPGALYVHQGAQKNKILIFMYGGGVCAKATLSETLQECYLRSKDKLGSSTLWPNQIVGEGYLSTQSSNQFANWTKILFPYCDGMAHQGYVANPYDYKGIKLYVRGAAITRQNIKYIQLNYNLLNAQKVVFGGAAEGGVGVFLWTNYLQDFVKNSSVVDNIIDSGLYVNATSFVTNTYYSSLVAQNLFRFANINQSTPLKLCNGRYPKQPWKCFLLNFAFTSISGRTLLVDSQYDDWEILNNLQMKCIAQQPQGYTLEYCSTTQRQFIQKVHSMRNSFYPLMLLFSKNSVWSISCSNHIFTNDNKYYNSLKHVVPPKSNYTVQQAVERFALGGERISQLDVVGWPNNEDCSGKTQLTLKKLRSA